MINRLQPLNEAQIDKIHQACMYILNKVGIRFNDQEALDIFKQHGFKVDGQTVFFEERQIENALKTAPSEFTIQARNPEKSIKIGGRHLALGPAWAAPYVIDKENKRRTGTLEDHNNLCKLAQTSSVLDFTAGSMAIPAELSPKKAATEMLASSFILNDMPIISNPCCKENGREIADMAKIVWGREAADLDNPISIVSVNPLSPLSYADDTVAGLIEFARQGQALLISGMVLAGISGPVTVIGSAISELTESLAGITLAQLVRPGTPCVSGGTSCASDMRTGGVNIGGPEFIQFMSIATQMANHYDIPCRYGGGLTDSFTPNFQAGVESSFGILASLMTGIHFMHQACGILGAYSAVSFEKFVLDEETCGMVKHAITPLEVTDKTIGMNVIERVGSNGTYMTQPETFQQCRTAFHPSKLSARGTYEAWAEKDLDNIVERASRLVQERLDSYVKPDLDPAIEKDLRTYAQSKNDQ
jgi:trimethylamine--corrinoid protein Co-methyltransferase